MRLISQSTGMPGEMSRLSARGAGQAELALYEATASKRYLDAALELMNICRGRLWDADGGGFFDAEDALLGIRLKPSDDMPHPAANSVAVAVLLKLYRIPDDESYRADAETILRAMGERASALGLHAGAFFCSLDMWHSGLTLKFGRTIEHELLTRLWLPNLTIRHGGMPGSVIPYSPVQCFEPLRSATAVKSFLAAGFPGMSGAQ